MANLVKDYSSEEEERMKIMRRKIGRQLRIFRKDVHKMSLDELAARSNVSRRHIIYIESGDTSVSLDKLVLVADVLRLEIKLVIK